MEVVTLWKDGVLVRQGSPEDFQEWLRKKLTVKWVSAFGEILKEQSMAEFEKLAAVPVCGMPRMERVRLAGEIVDLLRKNGMPAKTPKGTVTFIRELMTEEMVRATGYFVPHDLEQTEDGLEG